MMNTPVKALIAGYIAGICVSANGHASGSIWANKSSEAAAVDSDQKVWKPLGYQGPIAVPVVHIDGTIADTPEVAAARAVHLSALETARSTNPDMDDGEYDPHKYGDHLYGNLFQSKDITNSIPSVPKSHHATETVKTRDAAIAKVAVAKAYESAHSQRKASATAEAALALGNNKKMAAAGHHYGVSAEQKQKPYAGPIAMLELLPTGYLADTLEVTAAKNKHLIALAEAQAAKALWRAKYNRVQKRPWN